MGQIPSIRHALAMEEERESKPFRNPLGGSDRRRLFDEMMLFNYIHKDSEALDYLAALILRAYIRKCRCKRVRVSELWRYQLWQERRINSRLLQINKRSATTNASVIQKTEESTIRRRKSLCDLTMST